MIQDNKLFEKVFIDTKQLHKILPLLSREALSHLSQINKKTHAFIKSHFEGEHMDAFSKPSSALLLVSGRFSQNTPIVSKLSTLDRIFRKAFTMPYIELSFSDSKKTVDLEKILEKSAPLTPKEITKFTEFPLKRIFLFYPLHQKPEDIKDILQTETFLTSENKKKLVQFVKARDTLLIWEELCSEIEYEEDFSQAFTSANAAIAKAKDFLSWATNNEISLKKIHRLDLNKKQLTSLPPEIRLLTNLQDLDLEYNQLTSLPPEIGQLTSLKWLNLNKNKLTSLPPEIGRLTQLQDLDLEYNQLTSLPPEIGRLTQIEELGLQGNQLTSLPPEIKRLTQLEHLWISGNYFTSLPILAEAATATVEVKNPLFSLD